MALQESDYMMNIGDSVCEELNVDSTTLICKPPHEKPGETDGCGTGLLSVKVSYCHFNKPS